MNKTVFRIFFLTGLMLIGILVSLLYASRNKGANDITCVPNNGRFIKPYCKQIDSAVYETFVVAKMWDFEPKRIYIPVNSDLEIYLTSQDIVHGYDIEHKNVKMMAMPGGIVKTTVHFDKQGVYKVNCDQFCGDEKQKMQCEIIVCDKIN